MQVKIASRHLNGLVVLDPDVFEDERGFFIEVFRADQFQALGLPVDFVQDNHSRSQQGVVRVDELGSAFHRGSGGPRGAHGPCPPPGPSCGFEHDHRHAARRCLVSGGEAGHARADHAHVAGRHGSVRA